MRPESLVIYLDENHCNNKKILSVLQGAGIPVERHLDHFLRGTPDEEWLPLVGSQGWVLLTTDKRIRYRLNERRAVLTHRIRLFYFSKNDLSGSQMASALELALPEIQKICDQEEPPFFAAISRIGGVHLREKLADVQQ